MKFEEEIYEKYDYMIYKIVGEFMNQNREGMWRIKAEDLHSEGVLALIEATEHFDESKGNKFSTYAYRCIQNAIAAYVRNNSRPFKVSPVANRLIIEITKMIAEGKTIDEIAEELNISAKTAITLSSVNNYAYSFDFLVEGKDNEDNTTVDEILLIQKEEEKPDYDGILEETLKSCDILSEKDKKLFCEANGLLEHKKRTKKDIRDELGLTSSAFDKWYDNIFSIISQKARNLFPEMVKE